MEERSSGTRLRNWNKFFIVKKRKERNIHEVSACVCRRLERRTRVYNTFFQCCVFCWKVLFPCSEDGDRIVPFPLLFSKRLVGRIIVTRPTLIIYTCTHTQTHTDIHTQTATRWFREEIQTYNRMAIGHYTHTHTTPEGGRMRENTHLSVDPKIDKGQCYLIRSAYNISLRPFVLPFRVRSIVVQYLIYV